MRSVVFSQHGVVQLKLLTVRERTRALASISQPDFRHELDDVAENSPICGRVAR
ncbi:acetyl-CoA hydrolase/transferase C-terminal domain-containing protein [uncultured Ilumatobacter sp.]|uniref:acetyl-CoA hydrolase/transferase C-terminal domain-containing protein n=1 Tax=uncultured Ilumatobacter sp. TaxID=879968 RepID=UPI00374F9667